MADTAHRIVSLALSNFRDAPFWRTSVDTDFNIYQEKWPKMQITIWLHNLMILTMIIRGARGIHWTRLWPVYLERRVINVVHLMQVNDDERALRSGLGRFGEHATESFHTRVVQVRFGYDDDTFVCLFIDHTINGPMAVDASLQVYAVNVLR